jgi:predicted  nucleic acid-binding Zn-ribbon protein
MTNLVEQYKQLLETLETAKITKAELKVKLDAAETARKKLEKEILETSGAKTVEEAKEKLANLQSRIESRLQEAEDLLKELEDVK